MKAPDSTEQQGVCRSNEDRLDRLEAENAKLRHEVDTLIWLHTEEFYRRYAEAMKQALAQPEVQKALIDRMLHRMNGATAWASRSP